MKMIRLDKYKVQIMAIVIESNTSKKIKIAQAQSP